jgi:lipoate-protein ligase A
MLCLEVHITDPFFNLAAEEYLLRNSEEEFFMLWQSIPAVVTGKHQNALAEINYRFLRESGIPVARRLTGGGTVFHDQGNINFTFIRKGEPGKLVDFAAFVNPVILFLKSLGIEAHEGPKHEILTNGMKISGNAEHIYKNRVLHHGTLLFNTDLKILHESIRQDKKKYTDKAVQSNRSTVINLSDCLHNRMPLENFKRSLFSFILSHSGGKPFLPDDHQKQAIQKLANEKYKSWEWIYGWSPDYLFTNEYHHNDLHISISLNTHRGYITQCNLGTNNPAFDNLCNLSNNLIGEPHKEMKIRDLLIRAGMIEIMKDRKEFEELVYAFF